MKCLCNVPRVPHKGAFATVDVCPRCGKYDVVKVGRGSAPSKKQVKLPAYPKSATSLYEDLIARAALKRTNDLPAPLA